MPAPRRISLGFSVHTGRSVVVALAGAVDAPEIVAKTHLQVAYTFDEGAVYHAGQELPFEQARTLIRDAEQRFSELASAELAAFVAELGPTVVAAGMAAPAAKALPPLEKILQSHALVHAAEGELYRHVFARAAKGCGVEPLRVPPDTLVVQLARVLRSTTAKVTARLMEIGKASGKPWAADQKRAALAGWLALATSAPP